MGADLSQVRIATGASPDLAPFEAHIELLRAFLGRRESIVENIEAVLNAARKPMQYLQDRAVLSRQLDNCFFANTRDPASRTRLRRQVEQAHWDAGFRPREVRDLHNDEIHPAEMMIRAFYCWQKTHWPGRNGRLHYAQTLFNLYVVRYLQFLGMRIWDAAQSAASRRLADIQSMLDDLWAGSPADQPALVRDARWLIPLAQSLITDELAPYFEAARQVTETLEDADALEIQKAHVRMLGGHLTSQIRYYCTRDRVSIDERSVVLRSRASNALDFALLIQGLVGLLRTYDRAVRSGDQRTRLKMAGAVWQGISADPELFLTRIDLLAAYSMIEHVFIHRDHDGRVAYSPAGARHVQRVSEYHTLIKQSLESLRNDLPHFRPVEGRCSPYGVIFGLPSHLIEHMALKALQHDAETRFSIEDVFEDQDSSGAKLAWVNGWRNLPHIDPEVKRIYDYPQQFAEEVFGRIESELKRSETSQAGVASRTGRVHIIAGQDTLKTSPIPQLPARYFVSSDRETAAAPKTELWERARLLAGRREGHFLVSYETSGGWTALKKDLLTDILGAGCDTRITGLPSDAAQVLRLMCANLIAPENAADVEEPS